MKLSGNRISRNKICVLGWTCDDRARRVSRAAGRTAITLRSIKLSPSMYPAAFPKVMSLRSGELCVAHTRPGKRFATSSLYAGYFGWTAPQMTPVNSGCATIAIAEKPCQRMEEPQIRKFAPPRTGRRFDRINTRNRRYERLRIPSPRFPRTASRRSPECTGHLRTRAPLRPVVGAPCSCSPEKTLVGNEFLAESYHSPRKRCQCETP